jgi:alcohol dehydrogenase (cytochrome c)
MLLALDYETGKVRWRRDRPNVGGRDTSGGGSGILTTAGGLLFTGDSGGDLIALDASNGNTLWHVYPGGNLTGAPMTYELGGRQYVITAVDSVLYAWALPAR